MLKVANSIINASQIATPITFAGDVTLSTGCVPTCFGSAVSTQFISVGSVAASETLAYQMTYFT